MKYIIRENKMQENPIATWAPPRTPSRWESPDP